MEAPKEQSAIRDPAKDITPGQAAGLSVIKLLTLKEAMTSIVTLHTLYHHDIGCDGCNGYAGAIIALWRLSFFLSSFAIVVDYRLPPAKKEYIGTDMARSHEQRLVAWCLVLVGVCNALIIIFEPLRAMYARDVGLYW